MPGGDPQAALARLLCDPAAMCDVAGGHWDQLRDRLDLDERQVAVLRAISPETLRRYAALLGQRRLESLSSVFPASLRVLCHRHGFDAVAGDYWNRYPQSSAVEVDSIYAENARSWTRYVADQRTSDLPAWLADVARYELMRSRAVLEAVPPRDPWPEIPPGPLDAVVVRLAPGVQLEHFGYDMPPLYEAVSADRSPEVATGSGWLLVSYEPGSGLRELRVGRGAGLLLTACDGHRPLRRALSVVEIAAGSAREGAACTLIRRLAQERMLLGEAGPGPGVR